MSDFSSLFTGATKSANDVFLDTLSGEASLEEEPNQKALPYSPWRASESSGDQFTDLMAADEEEDFALETSIKEGITKSPDEAAKAQAMLERAGLSLDIDVSGFEGLKDAFRVDEIKDAVRNSPTVSNLMGDPHFAAVAHDDVENLVELENSLSAMNKDADSGSFIGAVIDTFVSAGNDVLESRVWDKMGDAFEAGRLTHRTGHEGAALRANDTPARRRHILELEHQLQALGVDYDGFMGFLTSAAEVVGQQVESFSHPSAAKHLGLGAATGAAVGAAGGPLAPVTIPKGVAAGLAAGALTHVAVDSFVVEGGHSYVELIKSGIDKDMASSMSIGVGVINAALEMTGTVALAAPVKQAIKRRLRGAMGEVLESKSIKSAAANFAKSYGMSIGVNVATEVMQELTNIAAVEISKEFSELPPETVANMKDEDISSRLFGIANKTFKAMAVLALPGSAANFLAERKHINRARTQKEMADLIAKQLKESKLLKRSPKGMRAFATAVMGERAVRVPVDKFNELIYFSGIDPNKLFPTDGLKAQHDEAQEQGGDVTIPTATFLEYIWSDEAAYSVVADHARWGIDGYTAEEAKEAEADILSEAGMAEEQQTSEEQTETADEADAAAAEEETSFYDTVKEEVSAAIDPANDEKTVQETIDEVNKELQELQEAIVYTQERFREAGLDPDIDISASPIRHPSEDIAMVEQSLGMRALFNTANEAGMTPREYTSYLNAVARSHYQRGANRIKTRLRRAKKQLAQEILNERVSVEEQVRQEIVMEPVYGAVDMTRGNVVSANKDFFRGNKAIDDAGNPVKVFHGTRVDFEKHKEGFSFHSNDPEVASGYATTYQGVGGANVRASYLSLSNPFIIDAQGAIWLDIKGRTTDEIATRAWNDGYDGVIVKNVKDDVVSNRESDIYVAFSPSQVKSAFEVEAEDPINSQVMLLDRNEVIEVMQTLGIEDTASTLRELRAKGVNISLAAKRKTGAELEIEARLEEAKERLTKVRKQKKSQKAIKEEIESIEGELREAAKVHDPVTIEEVSGLFDFTSREEFIEAVINAPSKEQEIHTRTDKEMERLHPSLFGKMADINDAMEAVIEFDPDTLINLELDALDTDGTQKREQTKVLRNTAKQNLREQQVQDISVHRYLAAASRAGKAAGKAVRKNDRVKAYSRKYDQLIQLQYVREAKNAQEQVRKNLAFIKRVRKAKKKKRPLTPQVEEALDNLLFSVDLGPRLSERKRKELQEQYDQMQKDGYNVELPKRLQQDGLPNYKNMTLGEFQDFTDHVRELYEAGRQGWKAAQENTDSMIGQRTNAVAEGAFKNLKQRRNVPGVETRGSKRSRALFELGLMAQDPQTILAEIDGHRRKGEAWSSLFLPIDQAVNSGYGLNSNFGLRNRERAQASKINNIFERHFSNKERNGIRRENIDMGQFFGRRISNNERLSILLNLGNEENKQALLDNGQYSQDQLDAVLHTATKRDLDFAQEIWDYLDSYWDEVKSAVQKRQGYTPTRVESSPILTKHGEYKGGYYPIRRETKETLVDSVVDFDDAVKDLRYGRTVGSHTANGHTKDRVVGSERPMIMDLYVINSHLRQMAYDLEMGDAVREAYQVLHNPKVKEAFRNKGQQEKWDALSLWIDDTVTAGMNRAGLGNKMLRWTRSTLTFNAIGWNFNVAALQWLGISNTIEMVGIRNVMYGITRYVGQRATFQGVNRKLAAVSPTFANRFEAFNKDVEHTQRLISDSWAARHTPEGLRKILHRSFFYPVRVMQQMVDSISWMAGYRQAIRQGKTQEEAIAHGDFIMVRSQSSADMHQRSGPERGTLGRGVRGEEWVKAFTPLMSFYIRKNNLLIEKYKKTNFKKPMDIMRLMATVGRLYLLEAMGIYYLYDTDEEERKELDTSEELLKRMAYTFAGGLLGAREIAGEMRGFRAGGSVGALLSDSRRFIEQAQQGEWDPAFERSLIKMLGKIAHVAPTGQVNKMHRSFEMMLQGEDTDLADFIFGYKAPAKKTSIAQHIPVN